MAGKKTKQETMNVSKQAKNTETMAWYHTHLVKGPGITDGKMKVPPSWITHPESCIAARDQVEVHVQQLMTAFKDHGVVDLETKIRCVCWYEPGSDAALSPKIKHSNL
jgi:hypothetical protein